MNKKRMSTRWRDADVVKEEDPLSDLSDISCPDVPNFKVHNDPSPIKKKRHKFTHREDLRMLKYIMEDERHDEIKGRSLWQDMENLEITNHTSQSMKYRFLNTVIKNLDRYKIKESWVHRFQSRYPDLVNTKCYQHSTRSHSILEWKDPCRSLVRAQPERHADKEPQLPQAETRADEEEEEQQQGDQQQDKDCSDSEPSDDDDFEISKPKVVPKRRTTRHLSYNELMSSSGDEDAEIDVAAVKPAEPLASTSHDDCASETDPPSDYDVHLLELGKQTTARRDQAKRNKDDKIDQFESAPNSEEEEANPEIDDDQRSRLQRRRYLKKLSRSPAVVADNSNRRKLSRSTLSSSSFSNQTILADFVTHTDDMENIAESSTCSSQVEGAEPLIQRICGIAKDFGLTNDEVLSTLGATNGNIDQTITYIMYGPRLSGVMPWTQEEDDIISSTDEVKLKKIQDKRGSEAIAARLQFLENL